MSIKFRCPCGKSLSVPDGSEGRRVRCPVCRTVTRLPGEKRSRRHDEEPAAAEEVQPEEDAPPAPSAARARILLADDDPSALSAAVAILTSKGYDTVVAEDGEEALELLEEEDRLDLAIVEVTLPKANGFEVCRAIKRADAARPPIPVIMVTARRKHGDTDLSRSAKADDFIRKPYRSSDLCSRVEKLLAR